MTGRAAVIGAGVIGASVALELARRGWRVTVHDRNPRPGMGSTARSSSVLRCHYTWTDAIRLAHEGLHAWRRHRGRARFHRTGVVFLFAGRDRAGARTGGMGVKAEAAVGEIRETMRRMRRCGVRAAWMDAAALAARYPAMRLDGDEVAVFEPDGGYVEDPRGAVLDLCDSARRLGVRFALGRPVTRRPEGDIVVNAAGPHSEEVNRTLGVRLRATRPQRQHIVEATARNVRGLPCMADLARGYYIRPDRRVFKVGAILPRDHREFLRDADAPGSRRDAAAFLNVKLDLLKSRFPGLALSRPACLPAVYDWTMKDAYPILDRVGSDVFVAIGTSGAWFKGALSIGWAMAEFITTGRRRMTLPLTGSAFNLATFSSIR